MPRRISHRVPIVCAVLGLLLAVLGAWLVGSRLSTDRARLDNTLQTTAAEKAALVATELERLRALAVITARVPPFTELYADSGSLAAKIASVAGPFREINNALRYVYDTSPSRYVGVGYIDRSGRENALVVRGARTPRRRLGQARSWPTFAGGLSAPPGSVRISSPFVSPAAHVPVIAGTTTVAANGHAQAYVELDLNTAVLERMLNSDLPRGTGVQIIGHGGTHILGAGRRFALPTGQLAPRTNTVGDLRLAGHIISESSIAGGPWVVVAVTRNPSVFSALAPEYLVLMVLALTLLIAALVGFRRARAGHAAELAVAEAGRAEAERLSRIDGLTGLHNRRHAMETIEHELARASREGGTVAVVMLDVDFFKRVNDVHGHIAGDTALTEIARRLRTGVRAWDTVARMGGEEFCVIAPALDGESAAFELAERVRIAVAERPIMVAGDVALPITVSAGVVVLEAGDGSPEHALDCADRALYAAKRRGRNLACAFSARDHADLPTEEAACLQLADALALTSDAREGLTSQHSDEVAELSMAIAAQLGIDAGGIHRVRLGGRLHDVGKIAVPETILTKPGPLTEAEWAIVRTHPEVGDELLRNVPELAPACPAVRHHHERWDGAGYPDALRGDQIPLEARIVCVADAYCAMLVERPHQRACGAEPALAELRRCAGSQFDPAVVEALGAALAARDRPLIAS
jgi:diguanylate cyclase (GGDEF)-like protein